MSDKLITDPILEDGVAHANFFNGRLLTAEALQTEQQAQEDLNRRLGQAVGSGVVQGLRVFALPADAERVAIEAGMAINGLGQTLVLPEDKTLVLVRGEDSPTNGEGFGPCNQLSPGTVYTGEGFYLVAITPSENYAGSAAMSGLGGDGAVTGCGNAKRLEGVTFRLVSLEAVLADKIPAPADENDVAQLARLRGELAWRCLGLDVYSAQQREQLDAWFGGSSEAIGYGPVDDLIRNGDLNERDVPLAVIRWTDAGLILVDNWSVRRSPLPSISAAAWPLRPNHRRAAEGAAAFEQFQDSLAWVMDQGVAVHQLRAMTHFRFLPAAGLIKLDGDIQARDIIKFFDGAPLQPEIQDCPDPSLLHFYLQRAWLTDPLDLNSPLTNQNPPIFDLWTWQGYAVFVRRENTCVAAAPTPGDDQPAPVVEPGDIHAIIFAPEAQSSLDYQIPWASTQAATGAYTLMAKSQAGKLISPSASSTTLLDYPGFVAGFAIERLKDLANQGYAVAGAFIFSDLQSGLYALLGAAEAFSTEASPLDEKVRKSLYNRIKASQGRTLANANVQSGKVTYRIIILDAQGATDTQPSPGAEPTWEQGGIHGDVAIAVGDATDLIPQWWQELVSFDWLIDLYPETEPWKGDYDPVVDPPPDGPWLEHMVDVINQAGPPTPVHKGQGRIYRDPDYAPGQTPEVPYAYLGFAEHKVYAPVLLTPAEAGGPTALTGSLAELAGTAPGRKLSAIGMDRTDMLAGAWTGLLQDVMQVEADTAMEFMQTAGALTLGEAGVEAVTGKDSLLAEALGEAGYASAADLANAHAGKVAQEVGISGVEAALLIEAARDITSEDRWSLGATGLDLSEQQQKGLAGEGIYSQGQLDATLQADQAKIEGILGTGTGAQLGDQLQTLRTQSQQRVIGARPVYTIAAGSDAGLLAKSGYGQVAALTGASADQVAGAFGGDTAKAQQAIDSAKTALGI